MSTPTTPPAPIATEDDRNHQHELALLGRLMALVPGMAYRSRPDRSLEFASAGSLALTGFTGAELSSVSLTELVHPADRDMVATELAAALAEGRCFELTYRILTRDGRERWVREQGLALAAPSAGCCEGFIADITTGKLDQERQVHDTLHDGLCGLANRALFLERLAMALRRSHRRQQPSFAVLCIDLDRFKNINDSLGRDLGDRALVATARRLEACLRQEDTVARVGSDEFAILLEELSDANDTLRVAQRVGEVLRLPLYLNGEEVFLTASLGIATSLSGYEIADDVLRDAEIAMNRAKIEGGDRHQLFDAGMHQRAVSQLRLETDLRRALSLQELRLVYQPILSLADGRLLGFEALLRWHRRDRVVMPDEFLGIAIETGLIVPISWWVLSEACRQLQIWQRHFGRQRSLYVSVNLTSQQLALPDLPERVRKVLYTTGLSAQSLRIEITESVLMESLDQLFEPLARLRELGVHIALDDFGTGYSSLSSLRQLPLGSLKIDRSFISGMAAKTPSQEIVRAIVALAHTLGLEVVAEGVETYEQVRLLAELGCDEAQGFLLGQPLDTAAAELLLNEPGAQGLRRFA